MTDQTSHKTSFTGCELISSSALYALKFGNVGVETRIQVLTGCGGLSLRTGTSGYLMVICPDRVEIQLRGATDADTKSLVNWTDVHPTTAIVTVAFVAVGQTLTAYLNGVKLGSVDDGTVNSGRVILNALRDKDVAGNVYYADLRVFYDPSSATNATGNGGGNPTYAPPKSPKASASASARASAHPSNLPTFVTPTP